ncbi:MAG: septum formation initiator family protein [Gemmatimonadota bacterium]|nr:septum formation initiator family protein [Gemmatimonadota bacterium]
MSDKVNRRASWAITGVALVFAAHYWGWGGEYARSDVLELRVAATGAGARVDSLSTVLDSLTVWADSLQNDPQVIERIARERHAFIRPGERLYLFVEDEPDADESEP